MVNNTGKTIWLDKGDKKFKTNMIYVIYATGEIVSTKEAQKYRIIRKEKLRNSYKEYPIITINWLVLLGNKLPVQQKLF